MKKKKIQFQNPRHQKIFDWTSGKQKKNLIARLRKGYEIMRVDGHECIEVKKGRSYRYLTRSGKDIPPP